MAVYNSEYTGAEIDARLTAVGTEFAAANAYPVGSLTLKDGVLYQKTSGNTTESWNASHWTQVSLSDVGGVDKTLAVSNKAADAKAAGDEIGELKSAFNDAMTDGVVNIDKTLNWVSAYIDKNGLVRSSSLSKVCVVPMNPGETVTIGTTNANITIIGSTTSTSVSVGDTVTVIQTTSGTNQYEEYSYTATENINVVLCVLWSNYNLSFVWNTLVKTNLDNISSLQSGISSINTGLFSGQSPINKDITWKSGYIDRNGQVRTSSAAVFCLIPMEQNEQVVINTALDSVAVISYTNATSVSVGDTVTTIIVSDSSGDYQEYSYSAEYDINLVLCVRQNNYTCEFFKNTYAYQYGQEVAEMRGATTPPSYFLQSDYLANKAKRINTLGKNSDDVFTFITDIHWEMNAKHSPDLLAYLADRCVINKMFDGGDVADHGVSTTDDTMINVYKKYRKASDNKVYHLTGNHDWFSPSDGKILYYGMDSVNNDQIGNPFMHYYYVDNVQQKIRYICLNSFTRAEGTTTITVGYDSEQIAWFSNVALDVPSGEWDVIVLTHFLRTTSVVSGGADIESAIASYNADNSHSGKVLAVIQGHTHWDAVYHTSSGVPVITTTCDKWDLSNESSIIPAEGIAFRELGTKSEQAFDVMCLDRSAKTITAVRIGAPAQNNVDKYRTDEGFTWIGTLEERVVSYE